jgi:hypothetical protein
MDCETKCKCNIEEIPEQIPDLMALLDAQRLARGIAVPGEPSFCRGCLHLVTMSDRIRELDKQLRGARS